MVGRNPGRVTTQGEILTDLFREAGYSVTSTSDKPNRYHRLGDIVWTLIRCRRAIDVQCLSVYGGPSFVVEDIASFLARRFGHRIVMTLRGGALPTFFGRYPCWARRVLRRAHCIVAPSKYLARDVVARGFAVQVIPNVIDLAQYPYRHREVAQPRLFWMRAFHPIWNPLMALRVLSLLRRSHPESRLVMAGQDHGLQAAVQREAQQAGLADAVDFVGFVTREAKGRQFDAADVFLTTNRIDNMPVAVVEACAAGLPVVSTNVGGIPDLLTQEETGLLVEDNDDAAMAQAIQRLLTEPGLAGRLSRNGRRLAESCAWPQVRPQWERIFAQVGVAGGREAELTCVA
jgi:glycosyltransferase involved in cell wall biosynthesis